MILVPLSVYNLDITSFELPGTRLGFVWEFEDVDKGAPLAAFMGRPLQPRHPMTIFSATFWTLDFVLAFFVGYYVSGIPSRFENRGAAHALQHLMGLPPLTHVLQGTLELRPQYTSRNYAKTWMVPDLILLMPRGLEWQALMNIHQLGRNCWWCVSFQRSDQGLNGSTLRSAKLLRAAKLPGFFRYLPMFISRSEYITLSLGIVRHLLGILFINHVIASFWYLLGEEQGGWLEVYEIPVADWWYSYLVTLHWSLTQFTPASMSVQPQTLPERAFNVAVVIFALVTFSSFVSSITNLMTHLRNLESGEQILFSKLEDFMQSRKFSFYLTIRVRRYLDQRLAEKRSKPEEQDIELLQRLSEPLKMEVHFEMHSPTLTKHPLLFAYSRLNEPAMMKLCHTALRTMQLSADDYLFTKGETAKTMYFAISGALVYTKEDEPAPYPVQAPAYFSEMVLWCPWSHCGSMRAKTDCKILCLDAAQFFDVVQHAKNCQLEVCAYAERALHIQNKYFDKDSRSDLNIGKYNARRIVKKTFPKGSLDVRPAWYMPAARSLNRHNSAGLMGGLRRQLSSQVSQGSESEASSDSSVERFSVQRRIVEQDNEQSLMLDSEKSGRNAKESRASNNSKISKRSMESELPPVKPPPSMQPLS
ncbi:CNGA3 [Symbiodinium pilosum]|uniref:CNGA3 protein n=1 Tax=Symbiodinium pilosum TaxID=2952 RepID=A0A812LR84_SYMPI|nr:CNGA3 [Symbiodinium pilosum]